MKSAKILRQKLAAGQPTLGVLITNHLWLELIEVIMKAGFDYAIVDTEHHNHGDTLVADALAMGRMHDFPLLLRPPESEYNAVRLAMDKGPCGLLLPTVRNAKQLDDVRDALYMPPRGRRRPGGPGNRWVTDFNYPSWKSNVEDDVIIVPQIEDKEGLANVDAIVGHEIVTAAGIGPYDLSAQLGVCWNPDSPVLISAIEKIQGAGAAVGKTMWMIGDPAKWMPRGFHFMCIGEPVGMLQGLMTQRVSDIRAGFKATAVGKDNVKPMA
jgi:4-hydroxy-2-oxoheptanedioate aldolase